MRRAPKAKSGELKMAWGKSAGENSDHHFAWGGGGASKSDANLLSCFFFNTKLGDKTLIEELKDRGYDLTTIKFSIQKSDDR